MTSRRRAPRTAESHTDRPHSAAAVQAVSTMRAIWVLVGGRGCGRIVDGGRTNGIGLNSIQPHRTAALHAPERITWIDRTLDAA